MNTWGEYQKLEKAIDVLQGVENPIEKLQFMLEKLKKYPIYPTRPPEWKGTEYHKEHGEHEMLKLWEKYEFERQIWVSHAAHWNIIHGYSAFKEKFYKK